MTNLTVAEQDSLFIYSLELVNFRQYYGKVKIEFSRDPKRNFTIIRAGNGVGKTNLLNAFYWCFYRKEIQNEYNAEMPIINVEALQKTPIGEAINIGVEIILGTNNKDIYTIKRQIRGFKNSDSIQPQKTDYGWLVEGLTGISEFTEFQKWSDDDKDWLHYYGKDFDREISNFLPPGIAEYIFFNGEKLESFFDFKGPKLSPIKDALENISELTLLDETIKHLQYVEKLFINQSKNTGGKSAEYAKMITENMEESEKLKTNISEDEKRHNDILIQLEEIDKSLLQLKIESVTKQIEYEKELKIKEVNLTKDLEFQHIQRRSHILSYFSSVLVHNAISQTLKIIDINVKTGKIPSPVTEKTCLDILHNNECICGTNIAQNYVAKKRIEDLLNQAKLEGLQRITNRLPDDLLSYTKYDKLKIEIKKIQGIISNINNDLSTIESERKKVTLFLTQYKDPQVQELEEKKIVKQQEKDRLKTFLDLDTNKYNDKISLIEKLKKFHQNELSKEAKNRILIEKFNRCQRSIKALQKVKDDLINEFRRLVEKDTKETFFKIIWKKYSFQDVSINDNYQLSVKHKYGYESLGNLSAGESLFLAISFISALKKIAGIKMPLILDSPLGKIDGEPRVLCAQHLPPYSQETGIQITMLLTGTEYDSIPNDDKDIELKSFREILLPYVGKEYKIILDEMNQKASIVNYNG